VTLTIIGGSPVSLEVASQPRLQALRSHFHCCCCCMFLRVICRPGCMLLLLLLLCCLLLLQPPSGPPPDAGGCRVGAITCWDLTLILSYIGLVGAVVAGVVVRRKRLQQQHLETALGLEGEGERAGKRGEWEEGRRGRAGGGGGGGSEEEATAAATP